MSKAVQNVLHVLQEHRLDKEADTLQRFYDGMKLRAEDIDNAAGKQKIVMELYASVVGHFHPRVRYELTVELRSANSTLTAGFSEWPKFP